LAALHLELVIKDFARWRRAIDCGRPHVKRVVDVLWRNQFGAFIRRRFNIFSRGGGDWPALALSTVQGRRKGRKKADTKRSSLARSKGKLVSAGRSVSILRNTGLLFAHIAPDFMPVTHFASSGTRFTATVSFQAAKQYPGSKTTTTDVLIFHQRGGPKLPQRKILVPPDSKTKQQMANSLKKAVILDANNAA
jgi:hypothetical protein